MKLEDKIKAAISAYTEDGGESHHLMFKETRERYSCDYRSRLNMFKGLEEAIVSLSPKSIIDAGAGFGYCMVKSLLRVCDVVHGVEIDRVGVKVANAAMEALGLGCSISQGNILRYDFSDWDMIYSYHPAKKSADQRALDEAVIKSMRPGALYARAYRAENLSENGLCEVVAHDGWCFRRNVSWWAIFRKL